MINEIALCYLTIALEQNCTRKVGELKLLFVHGNMNTDSTISYQIHNYIEFNESSVYLILTSSKSEVELASFPACEVVFSFQLIANNIRRQVKKQCSNTFFKVGL